MLLTFFSTYSATVFSSRVKLAQLFSIVLRVSFTLIESMHTLSVIEKILVCVCLFLFILKMYSSNIITNQYCELHQKLQLSFWLIPLILLLLFLDQASSGNCTQLFVHALSTKIKMKKLNFNVSYNRWISISFTVYLARK